jgi:hypothetical protein
MVKGPRLTKKDEYLLFLGILLALTFQVLYDVAHEVLLPEISFPWIITQCLICTLLVVFASTILNRMEQAKHNS